MLKQAALRQESGRLIPKAGGKPVPQGLLPSLDDGELRRLDAHTQKALQKFGRN
jgi:hypothetical protein